MWKIFAPGEDAAAEQAVAAVERALCCSGRAGSRLSKAEYH